MAINFEAANMAGYNNPKIEVFKFTMESGTLKITDAPSKSEIIRCLRRGSIPVIIMNRPDGSEQSLFRLDATMTEAEGDYIQFADSYYTLLYSPVSEIPVAEKKVG